MNCNGMWQGMNGNKLGDWIEYGLPMKPSDINARNDMLDLF